MSDIRFIDWTYCGHSTHHLLLPLSWTYTGIKKKKESTFICCIANACVQSSMPIPVTHKYCTGLPMLKSAILNVIQLMFMLILKRVLNEFCTFVIYKYILCTYFHIGDYISLKIYYILFSKSLPQGSEVITLCQLTELVWEFLISTKGSYIFALINSM